MIENPNTNQPHIQSTNQHYIQSLYESYKRKSFIPSYQIKYEIGNIKEKLQNEKEKLIQQLKEQSILSETISEEQLIKYHYKKQQFAQNQVGIQILKKSKQVFAFIQAEFNSNHNFSNEQVFNSPEKQNEFLTAEFNLFSRLFKMLEDFDNFFSQNSIVLNGKEPKSNKNQSNQFIAKLYQSILSAVCQKSNKTLLQVKVEEILKKHNLPMKRNKNEKDLQKITLEPQEQSFLRCLLHRQACEYALCNFLSSMISTTNSTDSTSFKYVSVFFTEFYKKIQSSISYLFIEAHQSHSANEPNWMFEYIQETFNLNYQWLSNSLLGTMSNEIQGNILIYILQYSIQILFYENIRNRFEADLNEQDNVKQPFFYFRFIDTLHELEEKLTITFSQEISLLQNLLLEFQIKRAISILERNFDYEHKWIEQKIFKDFWENINYSHIDLKNIEAYNIVTNFNVLFEKLYSKFSSIYDQRLVTKINKFYQQTVRNLAAHIKTSFERIYSHSGLDRLNIILAFKRVDNEFKAGLNAFIGKDLEFEKEIKKEYFDYIKSLFDEYALEHLNIYHRKLLKAAAQYERFFISQQVSEQDQTKILQRSHKIFKDWQTKLEELNKVYSYRDIKIKNQFFTFLESVDFSQKGITLFLQFYEPFLKQFYSHEAFNVLKMVILMDKKEQLDYLKVHNNLLGFLLESEFSAIRRLKIR